MCRVCKKYRHTNLQAQIVKHPYVFPCALQNQPEAVTGHGEDPGRLREAEGGGRGEDRQAVGAVHADVTSGAGQAGPEGAGGDSGQGAADPAQPQKAVCAGPPEQGQEGEKPGPSL